MNQNEKETRMATAPLWGLMLSMGIPTFVAQLINLLYNIVDRIYIGHIEGCGVMALTGVGLCVPVIQLVSAFSMFVGAGGAPLAAIALGKGDRQKAEKILSNGVTLLIIFSVLLTTVFLLIKKPFLYMFGASDQTFLYADQYLSIYLLGTIFVQLALGLNPYITAQGQSKIAMCSVLIGAVTNIILDPVFIFLLDFGVKGAAIATLIAQSFSAIWVLRFLISKKASLRIKLPYMALELPIVGNIAALGISPFIMSATESLIVIVFNRGMKIYGNDLYVGSITVLQTILNMVFVPMSGFSQGVQPIISYNYGAGNYNRVKETCKKLITITTVTAFLLTTTAILFPAKAAGLFTTDAELIRICSQNAHIFLAGMLIFGIQNGCQQSFMALGQAKKSLFFALFRKVILLVPLALILPACLHSVMGIYLAEPISDALSAIVCGVTFYRFIRKLN